MPPAKAAAIVPEGAKTSGRDPVRRKLDTADLAGVEALNSLKRGRPKRRLSAGANGSGSGYPVFDADKPGRGQAQGSIARPAQNPASGLHGQNAQEPRHMTFAVPYKN